jgi:hypothetical protein
MPNTPRGQPVLLALSTTLSNCDRGKREKRRRDFLKRHAAISIGVDEHKSFLARSGDRLPAHPSGEPARMLEMDWGEPAVA